MSKWRYDKALKTYINAAGEAMSQAEMAEVRDQYLSAMDQLLDDYATNLNTGAWTMQQFEEEMRQRLKRAYVAEYTLGKGGVLQMTQADYGRLGNMLRRQYGYLRSYLDDLSSGKETRGQAANRAKNFLGSARQGFSRGRGQAFRMQLPVHPGDGGTSCFGNCRCNWNIEETEEEIRAYWIVNSNKPCEDCQSRGREYSPFIQIKESA